MQKVKPGLNVKELTALIDSVFGEGLVRLGFIKGKKDFRLFSYHGYSHWIGLDVHDVGGYTTASGQPTTLVPGMVFTLEPGLYVRSDVFDWMRDQAQYTDDEIAGFRRVVEPYVGIGVRIEDDVLVTKDGFRNLTERAPKTIDDVEAMMRR